MATKPQDLFIQPEPDFNGMKPSLRPLIEVMCVMVIYIGSFTLIVSASEGFFKTHQKTYRCLCRERVPTLAQALANTAQAATENVAQGV